MLKIAFHICLFSALACFFSCDNEQDALVNPIPDKFIYETINLQTSIVAQPISPIAGRDNNFIYWQGGWQGLIIYRVSPTVFKAFDRNCPYQWDGPCALVKADPSGLFLKDTCCGSTFDWYGNPTGGPSRYPLKQYMVSFLNENTLVINNQQ